MTSTRTPEVIADLLSLASRQPRPLAREIALMLNETHGLQLTADSVTGKINRLRNEQATRATSITARGERLEDTHSPIIDIKTWEPRGVSVVETEMPNGATMRRTSATYAPPKRPVIEPVPDAGPLHYWSAENVGVARSAGERLIPPIGDPQWPYEDPEAWRLRLAWLSDVKPDRLILMGDETDFPTVSRHPRRPWNELAGGLPAEMAYAYARLREVREAVGPDCPIDWIEGNHDERLYGYLVGNALQLATLSRAGETEPVMSLEHLLRLRDLGITYHGQYPSSRVVIADDLIAIHGENARKGAGNSARAFGTRHPSYPSPRATRTAWRSPVRPCSRSTARRAPATSSRPARSASRTVWLHVIPRLAAGMGRHIDGARWLLVTRDRADPKPCRGMARTAVVTRRHGRRDRRLNKHVGDRFLDEPGDPNTVYMRGDEGPREGWGSMGLHAKLAAVMAAVGYRFAAAADAADFGRDELSSRQITMLPVRMNLLTPAGATTPSGKQAIATIAVTWQFTDSESGESITVMSAGTGADSTDKAVPKALTNALKYALLTSFIVPQGDDPEANHRRQRAEAQDAAANKPTRAQTSELRRLMAALEIDPTAYKAAQQIKGSFADEPRETVESLIDEFTRQIAERDAEAATAASATPADAELLAAAVAARQAHIHETVARSIAGAKGSVSGLVS